MQEVFEQIIEQLKGIWLKRRYIMITTWLFCPLGWLGITQLPDTYESVARVHTDTQSLLRPLLKGLTVETDPDKQVSLMVKTLLSRPNLERIARMTDLDVQATTPKEYNKLIEELEKTISIRLVGGDNIYSISYEHEDPQMSRNVVQAALTVFIENTLGESRSESDSAQKFLDTQIQDYEARLLEAEGRLTDFKQRYSGSLPGDTGGFYTRLNHNKSKLQEAELQLREATTKWQSAKEQLSGQKPIANVVTSQYDERIAQLTQSLDTLMLRYTDAHPDVKEAKRRIADLKKLKEEEQSAMAGENGQASQAFTDSPLFQELKVAESNLANNVASLTVRVKDYQERVKEMEEKAHTIPEIEAELIALDRDYDITKKKFEDLLNRRETARLAQEADETTDKIQFKVVDPPRVPIEPSGPKRLIFITAILIFGFGSGIGISFLFSQLTPIVTSAKQLSNATGYPVFGIVSATENLGLAKRHKRKAIIFTLSNSMIVVLYAGMMSFYLIPALQTSIRGLL
ncbi:chain length determinant family protein [Thalassomonas viridans]|uniref:Chain length determinant family protein n=1 Tax=Thalassomonas viridans TaxID=137584 RepID=A0AAF0C9N2_9GAMM|nr:XrtA system polysaccharide chain length determinant [Thalassomonas viridans]WDE05024.1 chain length determinant family protein [Thalassomonas viridans]